MGSYLIEHSPPLRGEATVQRSKNAVLPLLAASLLTKDVVTYDLVPQIADVEAMTALLQGLGALVERQDDTLRVQAQHLVSVEASYYWVQRMRASVLVMGPLLARAGQVRLSLPGGCAIGTRPIDLHLKGMQALGARIEQGPGYIEATSPGLVGASVYLDVPSVGATENILMAACLAKGTTRIENAAKEPEITDLARLLRAMGAQITGLGESTLCVEGVDRLHGARYAPLPDRIEAGTLMLCTAATGGDVYLRDAQGEHLRAVIAKLRETGVRIEEDGGGLRVQGRALRPVDIKTLVYPGFPTDLQAPMMALLCRAQGTSILFESIFENRYMHVNELRRMGASITVRDRIAVVRGVPQLFGAEVRATDLRAGAALALAGLMARGATRLDGVEHIERGYAHLDKTLSQLGAQVSRKA